MMLVNEHAETYASQFTDKEDELLYEIADFTKKSHQHAHMMVGQVQGKFLSMISNLLKPLRILEIGTFTGYSGLCLARGLQPNGELHTIEIREDDAATARGFFSKSLQNNQIHLHIGDALEIIPALRETWDIVFIDADKPGYIDYYELTLPSVRENGLIIADNVLFHGEVLEENITGKSAIAINKFNNHVVNDNRVEKVLLTLRDGLMLMRKR